MNYFKNLVWQCKCNSRACPGLLSDWAGVCAGVRQIIITSHRLTHPSRLSRRPGVPACFSVIHCAPVSRYRSGWWWMVVSSTILSIWASSQSRNQKWLGAFQQWQDSNLFVTVKLHSAYQEIHCLLVLLQYSIRNQKSRFLLKIESDRNRDFRAPPKRFCPL